MHGRITSALAIAMCLLAAGRAAAFDRDTIVGMWLFEENSGGTVEDASGMGHDGVLEDGPAWTDGR